MQLSSIITIVVAFVMMEGEGPVAPYIITIVVASAPFPTVAGAPSVPDVSAPCPVLSSFCTDGGRSEGPRPLLASLIR